VTDPQGKRVRTIGTYGTGIGEFCYPYSIWLDHERESLVVCEYGNNRIQIVEFDGRSRDVTGQYGSMPGEFKTPWAIAVVNDRLYVLDSGNSRIQVFSQP
jgi:DNA-binding beta-propeller fold protein YncE